MTVGRDGILEGDDVDVSIISADISADAVGKPLFTKSSVKNPLRMASLRLFDRSVTLEFCTTTAEEIKTLLPLNSVLPTLFAATRLILISFRGIVSFIDAMELVLKAKINSTERAVSNDTPDISYKYKFRKKECDECGYEDGKVRIGSVEWVAERERESHL